MIITLGENKLLKWLVKEALISLTGLQLVKP
jgi:hypothetical protein